MGDISAQNKRAIKNPQVRIRKRKGRQINWQRAIKNPIPGTYEKSYGDRGEIKNSCTEIAQKKTQNW